jgi:ABC-2 type transport system permease protein
VVAKTQLAASQIALIATFLPAFLLSGFLFAIQQMPLALQIFTWIIPARYYVAILKSVFLKGATAATLKGDVLALAVFAVIVATLARHAFHKSLAQ